MIKIPLYEYKCDKCNKIVEKLEFGKEIDEKHPCPKCGKEMHRVLSTYSFDIHGYCYQNEYNKKTSSSG